MKNSIAIFLAGLIFFLSVKDLAIYTLFKANQDFLSENLCINRFSPDELCYASCVLTQSIVDSQEQQENYPGTSYEKQQQVVLANFPILKTKLLASFQPIIVPKKQLSFFTSAFLADIFHPPEC